MPINSLEFLILVLYCWVLWFVYQSIVEEFDQRTAIRMNQGLIDEQLENLGLTGQLRVQCGGFARSPFAEETRTFQVMVVNHLPDGHYLYLDWQRTTFLTFKGEVKRVLRIPQGRNLDLFAGQSMSIVAPGETLVEMVTLENCPSFNEEKGYAISQPIFSIPELKVARAKGLQFGVNLFFRQPARPEFKIGDRFYTINCPFNVIKLPWQNAAYWRPQKPKKTKK